MPSADFAPQPSLHADFARIEAYFLSADFAAAEALLRALLPSAPAKAEIYYVLAQAVFKQNRSAEAVELMHEAILLDPLRYAWHNDLGVMLAAEKRWADAENAYRTALICADPTQNTADGELNLALTLFRQARKEDAIAVLDRLSHRHPHFTASALLRAEILRSEGRWDDAEQCYRVALTHSTEGTSQHAEIALNLGCLLLLQERFKEGWAYYEHRLHYGEVQLKRPLWNGESLAGKSLLIHAEQGLGDNIQFFRYIQVLRKRFPNATLSYVCPPPLVRLFTPSAERWHVTLLPENSTRDEAYSDFHCALLSVPRLCETLSLAMIPADTPYLYLAPEQRAHWAKRFPAQGKKRVGIAWAGNANLALDELRSLPLKALLPLLHACDIDWVNLQTGTARAQISALNVPIEDPMPEVGDFADTAALIAQLDLVISVDTAVIHLAGALNCPAYLLNRFDPDWRWLLHRDDSPWYPRVRIFRQQQFGNWQEPISKLLAALCEFTNTN